jgi:hypothetical protein
MGGFRLPVITRPLGADPHSIIELGARVLCGDMKGRATPAEIIAYGLNDQSSIPSRNRDFFFATRCRMVLTQWIQ